MKILIVEDEAGISQFLKQGLEEENYEVAVADDGKSGLQSAQQNSFDLIILDWMLPEMNGLDVCVEFRKKNTTTPIIFLTAKDTIQETIAGLKAGANDYIKKPFNFEELLERIKVQLRSAEADVPNLKLGPIEINKKTYQVFNNGIEVFLTQKEFSLLEYLIVNKDKVCTRNQIIEDVWNIHFEYDTGVIDVFINSLRKKLNLKKDEDYIKTIRGVGYIAKEIS
ncbi:DNA-binding response regulator [Flavobacterium noncentrifugens]|uniref:DNA-binding response regulator, OmpR family, contains REC and winged-helix (WHTH) domain n=1 Tax=Flavobacterium noncentrifugens TaxID=1128970 RepID=A0A1G9A2X4_9FLAO|nr:response regulator transcription factor [Flavobacterium noncentrifugens]GEP51730.1 DNA-binding response regulator [Flavobacterium noncentrifugens]SDK21686.1 DNA-binding response regulator, OmpR family, contains REC and winged-helix (wHTH) domain [Flavobacterium noncentrifugens]